MSDGSAGRYFLKFFSWRRKASQDKQDPKCKTHITNDGNHQTVFIIFEPTIAESWHPQEYKHRRIEFRYWMVSLLLSSAVAVGAGLSAFYTYSAAYQARRQADYVEPRAWVYIQSAPFDISATKGNAYKHDGIAAHSFMYTVRFVIKDFGLTPGTIEAINARFFINSGDVYGPVIGKALKIDAISPPFRVEKGNGDLCIKKILPKDDTCEVFFTFSFTNVPISASEGDVPSDVLLAKRALQIIIKYQDPFGKDRETSFAENLAEGADKNSVDQVTLDKYNYEH